MMSEEEFIKKAHDLTTTLIKQMAEFTRSEEPDIAAKVSLLALTKTSASIICAMDKNFETDTDSILDLFISTLVESVEFVNHSEIESKKIIDKMVGKQ